MPIDITLETVILKSNRELALGKLYQENIFTLQEKNQRGKILLIADPPPSLELKALVTRLRKEKDPKGKILFQNLKIKTTKDRSWEKAYQKHLKPFVFLKKDQKALIWIDPQEKKKPKLKAITLYLKAGLAFGTGGHPTTQLAAELMLQALQTYKKTDLSLLDMGCGTSLLAMTASKLGVKDIWAIDNDPVALEVSEENCEWNNISDIQFALSLASVRKKKFDLILANILLPVLIELKEDFEKQLKKSGVLIVSGLLYKDCAPLLKHYENWELLERKNRKGWSALSLRIRP